MRCTIPILILLTTAGAAGAQAVTTSVLADWDSATRPAGDRPALRDGIVAFLGRENAPAPEREAVFTGPLDGSAPFQPIAWGQMQTGDIIPWRTDGSWWAGFGNPVIAGGKVYFDGTRTPNGTGTLTEGFISYDTATGTLLNEFGALGIPSPGALGFLGGRQYFTYDTYQFTLAIGNGQALPGGGAAPSISSLFFSGVIEGWAQEDNTCVIAPRVTAPNGDFEGGVYTWSPLDGQVRLIANYATPFPGVPGRDLDIFHGVDTDGATVSFAAYDASDFNILEGVFTAPVGSDGAGPFNAIAVQGELSPFGVPYVGFGSTAIDNGIVVFDATIGTSIGDYAYAVFAYADGVVHPVFRSGEMFHGRVMADGRVNHRAMDGNDLVMWARYEDPAGPFGYSVMLLHINVSTGNSTPCLADTNGDGTLSPADFSAWIAAFNAGGTACDQNGDGLCQPSDFSGWIANFNAGC